MAAQVGVAPRAPVYLTDESVLSILSLVTRVLCPQHRKVCTMAEDSNQEVDPAQCQVAGEKSATVLVRETVSVTLQAVDKQGKEISIPVEEVSATLVLCENRSRISQCKVEGMGRGKYTILYTPNTRGRHQLHIKIGGTPIGCSPLLVVAKVPLEGLGRPVRKIWNLSDPRGVAVNSRGQILISEGSAGQILSRERRGNHVSVYSTNGYLISNFGRIRGPRQICFDSRDNVLVVDTADHQIHKFTPSTDHLQSIGSEGNNPLQFQSPMGIAYSNKSRKIYVSDCNNHRVQILNEDLSYSASFSARGMGKDELESPRGVAVDSTGNLYVADCDNNRIQVFTPEGQFLRTFGTQGSDPGQLDHPQDVHVDEDGTVYVADTANKRVSVFTSEGQFLTCFGQEHLGCPCGLTIDRDGFINVVDSSKKELILF